jgi:hypothetical protein
MKIHPGAAFALVLFPFFAGGVKAEDAGAHVMVVYTSPEKFSDIRDGGFPSSAGEEKILASLRDFITERAAGYIPKGSAFYINFVDIALAGKLQVGNVYNFRYISRTSSPVFVFGWAVTDQKGAVTRKGSAHLQEDGYMDLWSPAPTGDSLRYEKAVLDDWMRHNLQT